VFSGLSKPLKTFISYENVTDQRLFCKHRRPGILVLINDADWELEGQDAYELQAGDEVVFVSTLHGG